MGSIASPPVRELDDLVEGIPVINSEKNSITLLAFDCHLMTAILIPFHHHTYGNVYMYTRVSNWVYRVRLCSPCLRHESAPEQDSRVHPARVDFRGQPYAIFGNPMLPTVTDYPNRETTQLLLSLMGTQA